MSSRVDSSVKIAAIGDLMLAGEWTEYHQAGRLRSALGDLVHLRDQCDLLFANLEVTLRGAGGVIEMQPRLF